MIAMKRDEKSEKVPAPNEAAEGSRKRCLSAARMRTSVRADESESEDYGDSGSNPWGRGVAP